MCFRSDSLLLSKADKRAEIVCLPVIWAALLVSLLAGCGGNREVNVQNINAEPSRDSRSTQLNALMVNSTMTHNVDPYADYVIGSDDLLEIDVYQADELKRTVRVSSQGFIGLPLVGQIKAKGLTPVQLEAEIVKGLTKYMEEPLVSIYVKEYKSQTIGVIGAVTSPRVYAVTGQRYLLDMLSMAGGLSRDAGIICYILRPLDMERGGTSRTETIVIDLNELLEKGNIALNVPVFGGDVINVPKGGVFFVDGEVQKPGAFPIQGKTTLVQALAMSGGLKYEAEKSEIKVIRDNGRGEKEIITANYTDMSNGELQDIQIKENDIIIAPTSGIKNFLSGFMNIIRGFVSFGTIR